MTLTRRYLLASIPTVAAAPLLGSAASKASETNGFVGPRDLALCVRHAVYCGVEEREHLSGAGAISVLSEWARRQFIPYRIAYYGPIKEPSPLGTNVYYMVCLMTRHAAKWSTWSDDKEWSDAADGKWRAEHMKDLLIEEFCYDEQDS